MIGNVSRLQALKILGIVLFFIIGGVIAYTRKVESFEFKSPAWRLSGGALFSKNGVHRKVNVPLIPLRSPLRKAVLPPGVVLPRFLVYRHEYLSKTRDQGDACGSCWAFSICNMIADRVSINTLGKFNENLSVQQLLNCFEPDAACHGNSPENALEWMVKNKLPLRLERDEPYIQQAADNVDGRCSINHGYSGVKIKNINSLTTFIKEKDYSDDTLADNITNMKTELLNNGPFFAAITVYEDFFAYTGRGVYRHEEGNPQVGGHAIEVIGWCDKDTDPRSDILVDVDKGYWICRNSWGTKWPSQTTNKGFFLIAMGSNESGIESRCGSADPDMIHRGFEEEKMLMWLDIDKFLGDNPSRKVEPIYI